jgi:hypothetical protein
MRTLLHAWRCSPAALVLALAGCAAAVAPARYQASPGMRAGAFTWHEAALRDMGLPPLRSHEARGVRREMRLLPSNGPGGIPRVLVRVLDREGAASTVEWLAFWDADLWPGASAARKRQFRHAVRTKGRCGRITRRRGTEFCRLALVTGARAAGLVARLDSAGAWALPDPRPPTDSSGTVYIQLDGQGLAAEVRSGRDFRTRHFGVRAMRAHSSAAFLYRFAGTIGGAAAATDLHAPP